MATQSPSSKAKTSCDKWRRMLYDVCDTLNDKVHNSIDKTLHEESQKGIDHHTYEVR